MKTTKKFLIVSLVFTIMFSVGLNNVQAATTWSGQAPNALFANFVDSIQTKLLSAEHSYLGSIGFFKKLSDKAVYYEGYTLEGISSKPSANNTIYDSKSEAVYEVGTNKKSIAYRINIITKSGESFISFPDAKSSSLKNKWITVPNDKYDELGEKLNLAPLFKEAQIKDATPEDKILDVYVTLARKHNLFTHINEPFDDDYSVENATRYNLALDINSIVPFYKELAKTLTKEEYDRTILSVDGFEKGLSNPDFVSYIANHSFTSLWIDNSTQLPTRFLQIITLPPTGKIKEIVMSVNDLAWKNPNKPVFIEKPATSLSFAEGVKLLKVKIDTSKPINSKIKDLQKQLSKAKSKDDRAYLNYLIAMEFDDISDHEEASKYYKKSATYYKKGGVEYYDALAQAEWSLGNGKKVKEYYELALKKDPNDDFVLNQYGWFLTGLSVVSAKLQNLPQALALNTKLVAGNVDDSNLMNLYVTYLLLGRNADAELLKPKFDNFGSADNYNTIARAYHRLGNKTSSAAFSKLAADAGYKLVDRDKEFFALSF